MESYWGWNQNSLKRPQEKAEQGAMQVEVRQRIVIGHHSLYAGKSLEQREKFSLNAQNMPAWRGNHPAHSE